MAATEAAELVILRSGIVVQITAIRLLLDLEERGFLVRADADSARRESALPANGR